MSRSMPRSPLENIELERMELPVSGKEVAKSLTATPSPLLKAITFPARPPTTLPVEYDSVTHEKPGWRRVPAPSWSVGVVFIEGLGRFDRGLVADLGLIKLCAALTGRSADASDTEELLAPYGDWAGLASVYLLAGFARGLLPIPVHGRQRARTRVAA